MYHLPRPGRFTAGTASVLRPGNDLAFIGTGETVVHCLLAAEKLARDDGLECRVLSMHTVKPLDENAVMQAAGECRAIVTAEEHSVCGGLGEAVAGVICREGAAPPLCIVGIPDEDTATGSQADIFRHYGLSTEGLALAAHRALAGKEAVL